MNLFFIIISLVKIAILLGVILFMVSYTVYAERRVSAFIQDRVGPNRVGPAGLFQPLADMFKLLLKEDFTPRATNTFYFWLAPCLAVMPAIITIAVIPFGSTLFGVPMVIADVNIGILFVFAISSLGVYGIVIGGWASNSKYPFLGGIRSSAQMLSYELSLGLAVIPVFLLVGTLRLRTVVQLPDRARMVYRAFHRRLDKPVEMAAGNSDDYLVSGIYDCAFRRDKPAPVRSAGSRAGTGGRL